MKLPEVNSSVRISGGSRATILQMLGEGAQGVVYLVDINGEKKAMKWYKSMPQKWFVDNMRKNIDNGSPSDVFLWPEALTQQFKDSIGYIMPLKPQGSEEFSKFRLGKCRFQSMSAMLNACIQTCLAFKALHAHGLSFQDINDGGFFINPQTGDVKICDCDNVFPHGECSGILGKARFIAPEVILGKNLPDSYSDRFSMALMMFMFTCIDHPFEGLRALRYPCLTEEIETRLFGNDLTFIFDPADASNRPVHGVHRNALTMWKLLPKQLRQIFTTEFSREKLSNPQSRLTEAQWLDVLADVRDHLTRCPICGDEIIADGESECLGRNCSNRLSSEIIIKIGRRKIPALKSSRLYFGYNSTPDARIIAKPGDESTLLLQNLGSEDWNVTTPSGKSVAVNPRGFCPVKAGLTIKTKHNNNSIELSINYKL